MNKEVNVPTLGYNATLVIPDVEDVDKLYNPPPAASLGDLGDGEVVAIGTAVYEGIKPAPYDSHKRMCVATASMVGAGNLWLLNSLPRMPYPYSVLYTISGLFKTETKFGRKADWLLWVDDDVVVPDRLYEALRSVADPEERPFVTAVACDRSSPFRIAIWSNFDNGNGLEFRKQWVAKDPDGTPEPLCHKLMPNEMWAPTEGVHEIGVTGLCAALFHRSLFDKVPQPWFAVAPGETDMEGRISHKINTDSWWCNQMEKVGIKRYANADVSVIHLGFPMPVSPITAPTLRRVFRDRTAT